MAKQDYIIKNREWLAAKSREADVKPLDKGIYYRPVKRGKPDGASPNRSSVVTVHYTGKTNQRQDLRQQPWRSRTGLQICANHRGWRNR